MIAFENITADVVASEWDRFKNLSDNEIADHLQLGKILVWCKDHFGPGTLQKHIWRRYQVRKIHAHSMSCAKVFRAVVDRRFICFSEADYDQFSVRQAKEIAPRIKAITETELAEILSFGINGQYRLRKRSKFLEYPNGGCIYVMVASSDPEWCKIGGTRLDPYQRAKHINARTGVLPAAKVVPVWWEEVSDWELAEKELRATFASRRFGVTETFHVRPKEAIEQAMIIGRKFALPEARVKIQRLSLTSETNSDSHAQ